MQVSEIIRQCEGYHAYLVYEDTVLPWLFATSFHVCIVA